MPQLAAQLAGVGYALELIVARAPVAGRRAALWRSLALAVGFGVGRTAGL